MGHQMISMLLFVLFTHRIVTNATTHSNNNSSTDEARVVPNPDNPKELTGSSFNPWNAYPIFPKYDPFDPNADCSNRFQSRIMGGDDVLPNEMPWMAQLVITTFENNKLTHSYFSGVLIAYDWVIASRRCLNVPYSAFILTGIGFYTRSEFKRAPVAVNVLKLHYYDGLNNIALIKVRFRKPLMYRIKPACLPLTNRTYHNGRYDLKKDSYHIAGWGITNPNEKTGIASKLQKLDVPKIIKGERRSFATVHRNLKSPQGTCKGDQGAPLMCKIEGVDTMLGMYFIGPNDCDLRSSLAAFDTVKFYLNWI